MILCICWTQLQGKIEFISKCKFRILFYSYINAWYTVCIVASAG